MSKKLQGNGVFESSRMMLPEHIKRYNEHSAVTRKGGPKKRPVIDDMEFDEMSRKLHESKQQHTEIELTVWGRDEPVSGVVSRIDMYSKRITLDQLWGNTETVKLDDIVAVE